MKLLKVRTIDDRDLIIVEAFEKQSKMLKNRVAKARYANKTFHAAAESSTKFKRIFAVR